MPELTSYSSGDWRVRGGSEAEFVDRWTAFLQWTRENAEGFEEANLVRDQDDPHHFLSLGLWRDHEARDAWRALPDFEANLGACSELCDEFVASSYERVASV